MSIHRADPLAGLLSQPLEGDAVQRFLQSCGQTPVQAGDDERFTLSLGRGQLLLTFNRRAVVSAIYLTPGEFSGSHLPAGMPFSMGRSSVQSHLGPPTLTRASSPGVFGGPGWDRWDYADHSLHVQYAVDDASITAVTYMLPQQATR